MEDILSIYCKKSVESCLKLRQFVITSRLLYVAMTEMQHDFVNAADNTIKLSGFATKPRESSKHLGKLEFSSLADPIERLTYPTCSIEI